MRGNTSSDVVPMVKAKEAKPIRNGDTNDRWFMFLRLPHLYSGN
jgi:hypothetical protein